MRKFIGAILRKILPFRFYKLIANGFIIVPAYYNSIIKDIEKYIDCSALDSHEKDVMFMRKFAHIIDKGLHRKDIAPGHSKSIYELLKKELDNLKDSKYKNDPTYEWAVNKLKLYEQLQLEPYNFHPLNSEHQAPIVDFNVLFNLIKERRSNRIFKRIKLSYDAIVALSETVNWAANSCNKQPIKLFSTNKPDIAVECLRCCRGGTGFSDFIPSFWAFTADVRAYVWPTEMYLPAIDTSLGAQNLFLAATTLGISGTILTWAQKTKQDELKLRQLLNIPEEYSIIFCAVLGYADVENVTPARKFNESINI